MRQMEDKVIFSWRLASLLEFNLLLFLDLTFIFYYNFQLVIIFERPIVLTEE